MSRNDRLRQLLARLRAECEDELDKPMPHPLSGKPGFFILDPYPPGASDAELTAFAVRAGIALPPDLTAWLKITNGAPGFFGVKPAQKGCELDEILDLIPKWKLLQWIPVGYDEHGNYYVKVLTQGKDAAAPICFVSGVNTDELQYAVASDVLHFAEFKLELAGAQCEGTYCGWPFDRSYMLWKDPDLEHVSDVPLPWNVD